MKRALFVVGILLCAMSVQALEHVRVLVPVYIEQPIPGANGSLWTSRFAIHNPSTESFYISWCSPVRDDEVCVANLIGDEELRPGETQPLLPGRLPKPEGIPGVVAYLHSFSNDGNAKDVAIALKVMDVSRNALSAGTEIPVVRESSFHSSTARMLSVPADARFRTLLRIYEMNLDHSEFVVRVIDQNTNAVLSTRTVTLDGPPQGIERFRPNYAQIADLVASQNDDVRVEVEPLSQGSAFWTFVSVTNNQTQEFTIVSPQQ